MQHFAGAHKMLEAVHDLVYRCAVVPGVQVEKVDVVSIETLERLLDCARHVLAVVAAGIQVTGRGAGTAQGELCSQHELIALPGDKLAHVALGSTVGIVGRCVNEVAACFHEPVEDGAAILF